MVGMLEAFLDSTHIQDAIDQLQRGLVGFSIRFILVTLSILIGIPVAKFLRRTTHRFLNRANVDPTLLTFIPQLVYVITLIFVGVLVSEELGVRATAIVAAFTSSFLAIGLALQGSLTNFVAGILIILMRPFRVGDYIANPDVEGYVTKVSFLNTTLKTLQENTIVVPNAKLLDDHIINYSTRPVRRLDLTVGVGYDDDIDTVKAIALAVLTQNSLVLDDPPPTVGVINLGDSSVEFTIRGYVKPDDYWAAQLALTEQIKKRFDQEGISIPFPQRDVHLVPSDLSRN